MIRCLKTALSAGAAVALAAMLTASPAAAQLGMGPTMKPQPDKNSYKPRVQPPALPGAATRPDQAIPSDKLTTDMSPNDLLFDSINRGDIGDARDAITRGADLGARNVLGMTPLELSVDLSRNNITFLILSLRGGSTDTGSRSASAGGPGKPGAGKPDKAPATAAARPAKPASVATRVAPVAPQRQQLVSSDPGRPAPQAGFLGFGGVSQQ